MRKNDDMFDVDNIDIEEEMDHMDLLEDELALEKEIEMLEEKEAEESERYAKKARLVLNPKNLSIDLSIKCETDRTKYVFTKNGIEYKGCVIHKLDKTHYIFNVTSSDDPNGKPKLKKFDINEIQQVNK